MQKQKHFYISIAFIVLMLASLACGFGGSSADNNEESAAPAEAVAPTEVEAVEESAAEAPAQSAEEPAAEQSDAPEAGEAEAEAVEEAEPAEASDEVIAASQEEAPADSGLEPGNYVYTNGNFVRDIVVHEGAIWAATEGGVVAWDIDSGEAIKYTTLDGLADTETFAITVCPVPETRVVVGTGRGLSLFDPATETWESGETLLGPQETDAVAEALDIFGAMDDIRYLHCDAENQRLFFDYDDLAILDTASGELRQITEDDGLPWSGIDAVAVVNDDIWVASGYKGLSLISGDDITVYSTENENFPDDAVDMIEVSSDGSMWMAGDEGVIHYSNGETKLYTEEDGEMFWMSPSAMAIAPDDTLWIDVPSFGLCQLDPASNTCLAVYEGEAGMADGSISSMLVDEQGNLYYSTYQNGISMFDGSQWRHFMLEDELVASSEISAIAQDHEGYIWIGTNEHGITRADPQLTEWQIFDSSNSNLDWNGVDDIAVDSTGKVWILQGSFPAYFDGGDWVRIDPGEAVDHLGSASQALGIDAQDRIWIGGGGGLVIYDGESFTEFGEAEGWAEDDTNVRGFLPDGDVMWVSTTNGLLRFEGDEFEFVVDEETPNLSDDNIGVMAMDTDGSMLLGTAYDGVALFDGQSVAPVPDMRGSVASIFVKDDGRKLIGVGGEVLYFDGDAWHKFTREDGLPTGYAVATLIDDQGTLWMGGFGGLMRVIPE